MESISDSSVTVFVCANCARPGKELSSAGRARPAVPDFNWPGNFQQVVVPCTGRLQPEHVLRAFESGASIVSVIACEEDNCHYIEGSKRCARRVDYIRSILREMGSAMSVCCFRIFQVPPPKIWRWPRIEKPGRTDRIH